MQFQKWLLLSLLFPSLSYSMMTGALGEYTMFRDSSGTSWQPDSTPMVGWMGMWDSSMIMVAGFADFIYDKQTDDRGAEKAFSTNMLMLMAQKSFNHHIIGFKGMVTLEPAMGKNGYPLLFQTGETANGFVELVDRQHPHDAFMELALTYAYIYDEKQSVYVYLGLPGEPALGPPTFMHRWSAFENPEAPITHHWLDSTHITYGVATLGYVWDKIKLEASAFKGREPDQFRWNIESPRLDSYASRLTVNPIENLSMQISFGYLHSPEQLHPDVNTKRTTASISYNQPLWDNNNWQTTFAWGRNDNKPGHTLDGFLLESTITLFQQHTFFGRLEKVEKDELFHDSPLENAVFNINKLTLGYIYDIAEITHLRFGIGGLVSFFDFPGELSPFYGSPMGYMVFGRVKVV